MNQMELDALTSLEDFKKLSRNRFEEGVALLIQTCRRLLFTDFPPPNNLVYVGYRRIEDRRVGPQPLQSIAGLQQLRDRPIGRCLYVSYAGYTSDAVEFGRNVQPSFILLTLEQLLYFKAVSHAIMPLPSSNNLLPKIETLNIEFLR